MKTLKYLIFAMAVITSAAHAGREGGGGSQIETVFRLRAVGIIDRIKGQQDADKLCSAKTLRAALDKTKVRLREKIIDKRGNCSKQELLEACTYKHDIQLLEVKWATHLSPAATPETRESVDAFILHELYRATGSCNDDNYVLTMQAVPLLKGNAAADALSCPAGHEYYGANNSCLPRGQCPAGLVVSQEDPSQCMDLKTGEKVGPQQCGIGYMLTKHGCLPVGPCEEGSAFSPIEKACIAGLYTKDYYHSYNGQCYSPKGTVVSPQYCRQGSPNAFPQQYPYSNQYGQYYQYQQYPQVGCQYPLTDCSGYRQYQPRRQCYTEAGGKVVCY